MSSVLYQFFKTFLRDFEHTSRAGNLRALASLLDEVDVTQFCRAGSVFIDNSR